ncbi:MAG: TlpA disulfide reductase family protein, partial [Pseudomonadota bacterium]
PNDVSPFPFGTVFAPEDTTHWPVLRDPKANAVLEAAKSDWVILNIWATWCAPCVKELPDMEAANPMLLGSGVRLIAVNADPMRKDTQANVDRVFAERGVSSLTSIVTEGEDVQAVLAATGQKQVGFPTNLIFAPGGEPFGYFTGLPDQDEVWSTAEMLTFFETLVESSET